MLLLCFDRIKLFYFSIRYNVDSRTDVNKIQILVVHVRLCCIFQPEYDNQNGGVLDLYPKVKGFYSHPRRPDRMCPKLPPVRLTTGPLSSGVKRPKIQADQAALPSV